MTKIPAPVFAIENSVVEKIRDPLAIAVYAYVSFREQDPPDRDEVRDHFALGDEDLDRALTLLDQAGLLRQSTPDAKPAPSCVDKRPTPRQLDPSDFPSWTDDARAVVQAKGSGYVYVLSNPSMPGIVKIGQSIYGGKHRAKELYKSITGVPEPFRLEFEVFTPEYVLIEEWAHEALASARVNASREFFRCAVHEAVFAVMGAVATAHDMGFAIPEFVHDSEFLDECARITDTHPVIVATAIKCIPPEVIAPHVHAYQDGVVKPFRFILGGSDA